MEFDSSDGLRGRKAIASDANDGWTLLALGVLAIPCTFGLSLALPLLWLVWWLATRQR